MRKRVKTTALLLLSLAGVAVVFYTSLPALIGWMAQYALGTQGLSQPHVEVSRIGLDSLRIRKVRFTWNRRPVTLGPINITYGFNGLIQGRADTVRIEQGRIAIPVNEDDYPAETFPHTLPPPPILPFETLTLKALTFELPAKPAVRVEGQWRATGGDIHGRMVFSGKGEKRVQMAAEWRKETFALRLFAPENPASPWVRLRLQGSDIGLVARARLETSENSLISALSPWWKLPADWRIDGRAMMDGLVRDNGFQGAYSAELAVRGETVWEAELNGRVEQDSENLTLTVSKGGRVDSRGAGPGHFGISFPETFRAESRLRNEVEKKMPPFVITGQGELLLTVGGVAGRLSATANVIDPSLSLGEVPEVNTRVRATGTVRRDAKPPIRLAAAGPLHYQSGTLQWRVQPEARIAIPEPYARPSESPLRLTLRDEAQIAWRVDDEWKVSLSRWRVEAPQWKLGKRRVALGASLIELRQLKGKGNRWEASGRFAADSLQGFIGAGEFPALAVEGGFTAVPEQVAISAVAKSPGLSVTLSATHRLEEQTGAAHWQFDPVELKPEEFSLASFYAPWPFPFDVGKGSIKAVGNLRWETGEEASLSGEFDLKAEDLGGFYDDLLFSGADLNAWLALEPDGDFHTRQPAPLTIERMTTGIPSRNFQGRVALRVGPRDPLQLRLERPSVEALGGRVRSDSIELDFDEPINRFEVELKHIALDKLLALEEAPVQGFGRVSGTLPLQLTEEGLAMENGRVEAIESGVIRYRPGEEGQALEKSSQNMRLAIAALRDFRYESLKARADYAPSGQLDLHIRLMGNNPELFRGRSVQFNINIEENMFDLLRSLRAGQMLEGQIDEWARDFYRRRQNVKK